MRSATAPPGVQRVGRASACVTARLGGGASAGAYATSRVAPASTVVRQLDAWPSVTTAHRLRRHARGPHEPDGALDRRAHVARARVRPQRADRRGHARLEPPVTCRRP
jgi:hypothetical protein